MDEIARQSKEIWGKAAIYNLPGKRDPQKQIELYLEAIRIDDRNVLAYHDLAAIYLFNSEDADLAEHYCKKAYEVKDIPPAITQAPVWLENIHEEVNSDLDLLMMHVRLKQGRVEEAREYLGKVKSFFDKYNKGNYAVAKEAFEKYERTSLEQGAALATGGKSGCMLSLLLAAVSVAVFLSLILLE
jgi:tetratricopeptide (TPR) repeat protein